MRESSDKTAETGSGRCQAETTSGHKIFGDLPPFLNPPRHVMKRCRTPVMVWRRPQENDHLTSSPKLIQHVVAALRSSLRPILSADGTVVVRNQRSTWLPSYHRSSVRQNWPKQEKRSAREPPLVHRRLRCPSTLADDVLEGLASRDAKRRVFHAGRDQLFPDGVQPTDKLFHRPTKGVLSVKTELASRRTHARVAEY